MYLTSQTVLYCMKLLVQWLRYICYSKLLSSSLPSSHYYILKLGKVKIFEVQCEHSHFEHDPRPPFLEIVLRALNTLRTPSSLESLTLSIVVRQLHVLLNCFQLGDFKDLQDILKQSDAVISGLAALLLLHPSHFLPNDIDFYVMLSGYHLLMTYLQHCGYQVNHYDTSSYPTSYCRIHSIQVLCNSDSSHSVNVIVCEGPHILSMISRFHSTLVMNYISPYGIVCLYLLWTMMNMGFIINHNNIQPMEPHLLKYIHWGFKLSRTLSRGQRAMSTHSEDAICNLHNEDVLFIPFGSHTNDIHKFENAVWWELPDWQDVIAN